MVTAKVGSGWGLAGGWMAKHFSLFSFVRGNKGGGLKPRTHRR
jgi:hypothetical protein